MINQSLQEGYDSSLTSSMPNPSDPYSKNDDSNVSSCIDDEDEGIARKPNVMGRHKKLGSSDKKTANDSEIISKENGKDYGDGESFHRNNDSLGLHSSWEVIEGSSVVMEVEESFNNATLNSRVGESALGGLSSPEKVAERGSKKSSESLTATFASISRQGSKQNQGPVKEQAKEQAKQFLEKMEKKEEVNKKPFKYGHHSESEEENSEEEVKVGEARSRMDYYSKNSLQTEDQKKKELTKFNSQQNSSLGFKVENPSEADSHEVWIEGGNHVPKSDNGKKLKRISDSQSSLQYGSLSTHTSPGFLRTPKELKRKKESNQQQMSKNEFQKFIQQAKKKVVSEKSPHKSPNITKNRKQWKSPLRIVDKLVDDAHRRIKMKEK